MNFAQDPINYGEVHYPSSTQQLAERSHYTPPWVCAEMTAKPESSQLLSVRPFNNESPQPSMDIAPIELWSFAQFQIEQDRKFYATFPGARPTNEWPLQGASSKYFEGSEFQHGSEAGACVHTSNPTTLAYSSISYVEDVNPTAQSLLPRHDIPTPSTTHPDYIYTSDQAPDYNEFPTRSYGPKVRQVSPPAPLQRDCATRRSSHNSMSSQCEVRIHSTSSIDYAPVQSISLPQQLPSPPDEIVESHHVVPSHQPQHVVLSQQRPILQQVVIPSREPEPPLMDHLPSPTSSHSSLSPHALSTPQEPFANYSYLQMPNNAEFRDMECSGYWPIYPQPLPGSDHRFRHHGHPYLPPFHDHRPPIRPPGWPILRPPSPRIRLSPLPSKRVLEKKPPLACLFCRGRKIACGPPEPGTTEKTCNQCQRRSIKCEYPSESRRGMRNKKSAATKVNTAGPKVKLGKRPKLNG